MGGWRGSVRLSDNSLPPTAARPGEGSGGLCVAGTLSSACGDSEHPRSRRSGSPTAVLRAGFQTPCFQRPGAARNRREPVRCASLCPRRPQPLYLLSETPPTPTGTSRPLPAECFSPGFVPRPTPLGHELPIPSPQEVMKLTPGAPSTHMDPFPERPGAAHSGCQLSSCLTMGPQCPAPGSQSLLHLQARGLDPWEPGRVGRALPPGSSWPVYLPQANLANNPAWNFSRGGWDKSLLTGRQLGR